jgi:hypothetical protein
MFEIFGYSIYLFPFWKIDLLTKLPMGEVIERIENATNSKSHKSPSIVFHGKVIENKVRLRRHINYRNSFQALVWGTVHSEAEGTVLSVWFFVHPSIYLFAAIPFFFSPEWSGILTFWYGSLCLMTIAGFTYDANRVEEELFKLLDERA